MKIVYFIYLLFICHNIYGQSFTINGRIIGKATGVVILRYTNASFEIVSDTSFLQEGRFHFTGSVKGADYAFLINDPNYLRYDGKVNGFFFIEPGIIEVTYKYGDMENAKITGCDTQEELDRWNNIQMKELRERKSIFSSIDSIRQLLKTGSIETSVADEKIKSLNKRYSPIRLKIADMDLSYIKQHPNSYLSLKFLGDYAIRLISEDSANVLYTNLSDKVKNSSLCSAFRKDFSTNSKNIKLTHPFDDIKVDEKAPNYIVYKGKENINLESFKDEVVLLEFWELSCLPCLQFNPELEKIRKKFSENGLKIIGITNTSAQELLTLMSYIKKSKLSNWIHVSISTKAETTNSGIFNGDFNSYYSPGVPKSVLINKRGKVIYKNFGYSPDDIQNLETLVKAAVNETNK